MTTVKKLVSLSTAVMLVMLGAGTSLATTPATAKSKPVEARMVKHPSIQTVAGTLSAVNPASKTVEVTVPKGKADHLVVGATVTDQTIIKEGKAKKSLADLKVGEHVRMRFERVSSGDVAKTIVIKAEKHHRG
jgi:cytoskeletal protein RodZ